MLTFAFGMRLAECGFDTDEPNIRKNASPNLIGTSDVGEKFSKQLFAHVRLRLESVRDFATRKNKAQHHGDKRHHVRTCTQAAYN